MTTADPNKIKAKYADKLARKSWQLDNSAGLERLAKAVIVGDEVKKNSCFGAVVSVLAIIAALAAVFGSRNEPLCICLEFIGDNGECEVHGKGHK